MSALRVAPSPRTGSEQALIAAVRRGNDRAFEQLYGAYRARVHAYVLGMVGDHGRAEDVTQEVFISALRRIRETDRPIAFKAWIYEIAKNACIDQARRARRRVEVPLEVDGTATGGEADNLLGGHAHRHLTLAGAPDAAILRKQQLADLCGAFGGLSEAHHQVLVMRELEGRSYAEIGEELGMSRPVVESTLFRARRKLTEEYEEIASGRRCEQVQALIDARTGRRIRAIGVREQRRLARHLAYCQPCRRHAHLAGFDHSDLHTVGIAQRIAALLPIPWLGRILRGTGQGAGRRGMTALQYPGSSVGFVDDVARVVDSGAPAVISRAAAAVVAVALAGAGTGLVTNGVMLPSHAPQGAGRAAGSTASASPVPAVPAVPALATAQAAAAAWSATARTVDAGVVSGASRTVETGAGGAGRSVTTNGGGSDVTSRSGAGRSAPSAGGSATAPLTAATGGATGLTSTVTGGAAKGAVGTATSATTAVSSGGTQGGTDLGLDASQPVQAALSTATGGVTGSTGPSGSATPVRTAVSSATGTATSAAGSVTSTATQTTQQVASTAGSAVSGTTSGVKTTLSSATSKVSSTLPVKGTSTLG